MTILGVLSGAGIFNGIIKLVAEHQYQPDRLRAVLGTGLAIVLCFSLLLIAVFIFASDLVSRALFGQTHYQRVISVLAIIQLGIAYANLGLAVLKGYRDAAGNAVLAAR